MSTHIRLADLTDKALNLLKAQGLSASTLGGYTKKYEYLKKHFASLGSAYYDESLLSRFMVDYEEKHKNGIFVTFICAFLILSNGMEAKVGTLGSKYEFFHEWKRLSEQVQGNVALETMLRGICKKENFLDLLEKWIWTASLART